MNKALPNQRISAPDVSMTPQKRISPLSTTLNRIKLNFMVFHAQCEPPHNKTVGKEVNHDFVHQENHP